MVLPVTDLGFGLERLLAAAEAWDGNSVLGSVHPIFAEYFMDGLSGYREVDGQLFHRSQLVPVFGDDGLLV